MSVRHQLAVGSSTATTAVGATVAGLSLSDWQSIAGIVAACVGIVATVAVTTWRYLEFRRRMSQ